MGRAVSSGLLRQGGPPGAAPGESLLQAPVHHLSEARCGWGLTSGQVTLVVKATRQP